MPETREEVRARERLRGMDPAVACDVSSRGVRQSALERGQPSGRFCQPLRRFLSSSHRQSVYLDREEVEDAINYILLELIENALKYSLRDDDVDVDLEIQTDEMRFIVANPIQAAAIGRLETTFHELYSDDPADLLVRRIEENAANPESLESGLGLLTILSDYSARVAWEFTASPHSNRARLTITTRFPVYRSER